MCVCVCVMLAPVPKQDRTYVQCLLVPCCDNWGALHCQNSQIKPTLGWFGIFEVCVALRICQALIGPHNDVGPHFRPKSLFEVGFGRFWFTLNPSLPTSERTQKHSKDHFCCCLQSEEEDENIKQAKIMSSGAPTSATWGSNASGMDLTPVHAGKTSFNIASTLGSTAWWIIAPKSTNEPNIVSKQAHTRISRRIFELCTVKM